MKFLKISLALLVPVLLLACLVFLTTGAGSYKVYVIHTGSMSPTIPSGSAVVVHEGHYHVGQVITFTEDGLTVTHRLVSISAAGLTTTKGDANKTNDPWHVPKSQIIGGVVLAPRDVGYAITYLKDPLGLGSVLLAALFIWQISAMMRTEEPKGEESNESPSRRSRKRAARRGDPSPSALPELVSTSGDPLPGNGDFEPEVPELVTTAGGSFTEHAGVRPVFPWPATTKEASHHEIEVVRPAFPWAPSPTVTPQPDVVEVQPARAAVVTAAYAPPKIEEVRPAFPWSFVAKEDSQPTIDQNPPEDPDFAASTSEPFQERVADHPAIYEFVPPTVDSLASEKEGPSVHTDALEPPEDPTIEIVDDLSAHDGAVMSAEDARTTFEEVPPAPTDVQTARRRDPPCG